MSDFSVCPDCKARNSNSGILRLCDGCIKRYNEHMDSKYENLFALLEREKDAEFKKIFE